MPRIQTLKAKKFPEGWEFIEPTLTEMQNEMKDVENAPHEGKRRVNENYWNIYKLHHQRSRYIYDLFYKKKEISKELYEYCLREKWADQNLIAKWKKSGYERLCCVGCIQSRDTNFQGVCICRVPKTKRQAGQEVQCQHCGCKGCASGD